MLTVLVALLVFGVMILLHELGHFLAARHCGVRVEEFSVGFGPALWSTVKNGTRYSLRLLPLGGYNLLAQENGAPDAGDADGGEEGPDSAPADRAAPAPAAPDADGAVCVAGKNFPEAGVWQRFFIIAAGALMNFALGFALLLALQCAQDGAASRVVYDFLDGATSQADGLQAGDKILQVNGRACFVWGDILYELAANNYQPVALTVLRGGQKMTLPAVRISAGTDDEGHALPVDFHVYGVKNTPTVVVKAAAGNFLYYARALVRSFADLARGAVPVSDLSGPVGVVEEVHKAIQYGWQDVANLAVLLTINLGIFNLLPLPGLDGGKLLFLAIEGISRRKLPPRLEEAVTLAGMMALVALMLFVTFNDVLRLF